MSQPTPLTFLCVMAATKGLYGLPFLRKAKEEGVRLLVLTEAKALPLEWPREILDGLYAVHDIFDPVEVRHAVSYLARSERIDRVIGLGEYDIEIASALREHMRLPGMGVSTSHHFRDKLAMRKRAVDVGLPVPPFSAIFHHHSLYEWMMHVPGPWVIKPRTGASSLGIRKVDHPDQVWHLLDQLGDRQSMYLIEQFIPGTVYHVDSVVNDRKVLFAQAHQYGTPILELHQRGGVYTTHGIERGSPDEKALQDFNKRVIEGLGLQEGVTHIEYIKGHADGTFYFLEASARVGAGMIEELIEASSGLNLWAEWARIEIAQHREPYKMPKPRKDYAGVAICMTGVEWPDLSAFQGPGVQASIPKPYHVAVLVSGPDAGEVERKVEDSARRLAQMFLGAPV